MGLHLKTISNLQLMRVLEGDIEDKEMRPTVLFNSHKMRTSIIKEIANKNGIELRELKISSYKAETLIEAVKGSKESKNDIKEIDFNGSSTPGILLITDYFSSIEAVRVFSYNLIFGRMPNCKVPAGWKIILTQDNFSQDNIKSSELSLLLKLDLYNVSNEFTHTIVGRIISDNSTVGYQLIDRKGQPDSVDKNRLYKMALCGVISNCKATKSNGKVALSGIGCDLTKLKKYYI